jgi:hypothetical protein
MLPSNNRYSLSEISISSLFLGWLIGVSFSGSLIKEFSHGETMTPENSTFDIFDFGYFSVIKLLFSLISSGYTGKFISTCYWGDVTKWTGSFLVGVYYVS